MNIEEAFDIITKATAVVHADRATHIKIQQALDLIKQTITTKANKPV